jgi:twinkle protein
VVNHKYRTLSSNKQFSQDADAKKCLWNFDALTDPTLWDHPVIITEGEMDALAAIQSGYARTASVPDGAPAKEVGGAEDSAKYSYVAEARAAIAPSTIVILATDGDGPGINLMNDLALRFGKPRCKFLTYPKTRDGKRRLKDLNEVLEHYGLKGVVETINRAQWVSKSGVYSMAQRPDRPDKQKYSLHMGRTVDACAKARRGDFWVVAGLPGHGKSAFADDMLCRLALHEGLRVCFASFEKEPETDHRRDLRKWYIGEARGHSNGDVWTREEFRAADDFIENGFRFVVPSDEDDTSLDWLMEQFEIAVVQQGCDVCVIDPWNEVEHVRPADQTLTEYVGWAIKRLKRLAKFLNVLVVVVAHPAKMKKDEELTLHSISDSAHWSNKCDVGLLIARNFEESMVTAHFTKVRNDDIGRYGKAKAFFDTVTRHFKVYD